MSKLEFVVELYNDDTGEDEVHALPGKHEVCHDCEGYGYVLTPSIRNHCYSAEEFYESYDDEEDREEYFKRGGKYDVICPTCKGKNVVVAPDVDHFSEADKEIYKRHCEAEHEAYLCDRESEMERRMGA